MAPKANPGLNVDQGEEKNESRAAKIVGQMLPMLPGPAQGAPAEVAIPLLLKPLLRAEQGEL